MIKLSVLHNRLRRIEQKLPLADKIGIPLTAIAVLTAAVLSTQIITLTHEQIDRSYRNQTQQLANLIQAGFDTEYSGNFEDREMTSRFLKTLTQSDPNILDIHIYRLVRGQPTLWASAHPEEPLLHVAQLENIEPIRSGETKQIFNTKQAHLETILPLKIQGQTVASISLYTSLEPRNQAIAAATRTILFAAGLGIFAQSAALMLVLYWAVLHRIKQLSQAALRVAEGDTSFRLPIENMEPGKDEILNVAREFDRMLKAVQRRSQQQEALATFGQQAIQEVDLVELLDKAVQLITHTLKIDYVEILEFLPDCESLQVKASAGWETEPIERHSLSISQDSLLADALETNEPIVIDHLHDQQPNQDRQLLQAYGVVGSIHVLIVKLEKPFGILSAHSKTQRSFCKDDILFLQAVASLLAAAIVRYRVETVMAQAEAAFARAEAAETAKQVLEKEILERQRVEAALRESEERYALAASGANDGLWDWDLRNNEVYFSTRWKTMLGHEETEIGSNPNEWFDRIHPDDYERVQLEIHHHREGLTAHFESEFRLRHKDGTFCWILSRGLAVRDAAGNVYRIAGSQTDVTDRKLAEEKLLHHALHDELTGLANRALFVERLERAITRLHRHRHATFAVLFLDLDRFKVINDSLGHLVGDQLLMMTAERLRRYLRTSDTCARLGGDEFAILLEDIQETQDVITIVEGIQQELRSPFILAGQEVFVNGSIGLVLDTRRYRSKEELLRDADTAMYRSKALGRGCYTIFTPLMHEQAVTLLHLEADLRRALERQELRLYYQPILVLNNQRLTGFEALLRWQHPQRGLLLPADFIPVAEETGLIISIGWWVLREACRQMRQWQQDYEFDRNISMSVNLSGKQFAQPDLVEQVAKVLEETGLEPYCLKLEITESVIMTDAAAAANMMEQLKTLGVQLAMDDFGTGYSSLSYLHRFPIDTLKIDRSFISTADTDLEKLEITRTVISLAWNLGMNVVAEGVETDRQMAQLKLLKCELAQGFLFSHPLDEQGISNLLEQNMSLCKVQP